MLHRFSDLPSFQRDPLKFFRDKGNNAKTPLVRMRVGPRPVYLVTDADIVKPVLMAKEGIIGKGRLIYKLRQVIGKSSITMSGPEHKTRRAALAKQLAAGLSGSYVPQIAATIRQTAAQLAREGEVDAHRISALMAMRVICTILFGRDTLSPGDENAIFDAVHLVQDDLAEDMFRALPHTPWAHWRKKKKLRQAHRIMSLVVERVRKKAGEDSLMKTFEELGLEGDDLRDEVLLMLLAGHHTTGSATAWLYYHLATEEGLADKIAEEARMLGDGSGEFSHLDVKNAQLSRNLVMEVLRLYPSTYWLSREVMQDTEVAGMKLKKGTTLIISAWHLHSDPRYWENPERFDLTRSYANKAYIPFGAGPRACTGMGVALLEMQLMALEFASAFNMQVTSVIPAQPPKPSITLIPSDIKIRFEPRDGLGVQSQNAA